MINNECIDVIESAVSGLSGMEAVDTAKILEYIWKWKFNNNAEALDKASWYLNHLKDHLKGEKYYEECLNNSAKPNFINPSAKLISWDHPLKFVELVARVCYKSESKITEDSSIKLVNNLIQGGHYAMLEHCIFSFAVSKGIYTDLINSQCAKYMFFTNIHTCIVSVNLRTLIENAHCPALLYLLKCVLINFPEFEKLCGEAIKQAKSITLYTLKCHSIRLINPSLLSEEERAVHKFYSIKFVTDRGVSHEIVRHRNSFAQESTRYVNYMKRGLTFIRPTDFDNWNDEAKNTYTKSLIIAEQGYLNMIKNGCKPQEARSLLPTSIKTEVVMTCNIKRWKHFFNLRVIGTTGCPHPDMKKVALEALEQLQFDTAFNAQYKLYKDEEISKLCRSTNSIGGDKNETTYTITN